MESAVLHEPALGMYPPVESSGDERAAIIAVGAVLNRANAGSPRAMLRLMGPGNQMAELPESIVRVLARVVDHMTRGQSVMLIPIDKQMTTRQAADILNVSRPHVISLLERGEMPCVRTAGGHRRIPFGDLIAYKRRRDAERRVALDHLVHLTEDLGLYEDEG